VVAVEEKELERVDPVYDRLARQAVAAVDITGLRLARLGNTLWAGLQMRGLVRDSVSYRLMVRAFSADGAALYHSQDAGDLVEIAFLRSDTVWYKVDLDALGQPDWLALTGEARQGVAADRTAWYLVRLENAIGDLLE